MNEVPVSFREAFMVESLCARAGFSPTVRRVTAPEGSAGVADCRASDPLSARLGIRPVFDPI